MAVPAAAPVEILGIAGMDAPDEPRQRRLVLRHDDQMDVVRYPAPAQHLGPARSKMEQQKLLVAAPVFACQEDLLAIVAAMGDVMGRDRRPLGRCDANCLLSPISLRSL